MGRFWQTWDCFKAPKKLYNNIGITVTRGHPCGRCAPPPWIPHCFIFKFPAAVSVCVSRQLLLSRHTSCFVFPPNTSKGLTSAKSAWWRQLGNQETCHGQYVWRHVVGWIHDGPISKKQHGRFRSFLACISALSKGIHLMSHNCTNNFHAELDSFFLISMATVWEFHNSEYFSANPVPRPKKWAINEGSRSSSCRATVQPEPDFIKEIMVWDIKVNKSGASNPQGFIF